VEVLNHISILPRSREKRIWGRDAEDMKVMEYLIRVALLCDKEGDIVDNPWGLGDRRKSRSATSVSEHGNNSLTIHINLHNNNNHNIQYDGIAKVLLTT